MAKYTKDKITQKPIDKTPEKSSDVVPKTGVTIPLFKPSMVEIALLYLFASILSVILINNRTSELNKYISVSDELNIIDGVTEGVEQSGIPSWFSDLNTSDTDYFDNIVLRPYRLECHLRYPFYNYATDNDTFDWKSESNLWYFYAFILSFVLLAAWRKSMRQLFPYIAVFLLLMSISVWTASAFHYVRYYAYLIMASAFSLYVGVLVFATNRIRTLFKLLLLGLLAAFPTLFHYQGAFMLFLWIPAMVYLAVKRVRAEKNKRTRTLVLIISASFLIPAGFLIKKYIRSALYLFNPDNFDDVFVKFFELSVSSDIFTLVFFFGLLGALFFSWKYLTYAERALILFSAFLLISSLIGAGLLMGAEYSEYNGANRYLTFSHVMWLILNASLALAFVKFLSQKLKFVFIYLASLAGICALFFYNVVNFSPLEKRYYNFSIVPVVEKADIEFYQTELADIDYAVVSAHTALAKAVFTNKEIITQIKLAETLQNTESELPEYLVFYYINADILSEDMTNLLRTSTSFSTEFMLLKTNELKK